MIEQILRLNIYSSIGKDFGKLVCRFQQGNTASLILSTGGYVSNGLFLLGKPSSSTNHAAWAMREEVNTCLASQISRALGINGWLMSQPDFPYNEVKNKFPNVNVYYKNVNF